MSSFEYPSADYQGKRSGYPLLDALPAQMSVSELQAALLHVPALPDGFKKLSASERLVLAENIQDIYVPLDYAAITYNLIYSGIRSSYRNKTKAVITRNLSLIGKAIGQRDPFAAAGVTAQAESFSLLGEPGMGKTETVTRILNTIPQVIRHTQYMGEPFEEYQIVYLKIECPANNSPRGACFQILAAIDDLLGTALCEEGRRSKYSVDTLIMRIAQICTRFHVGCIVIDEIQNILSANSVQPSANNQLVKFLVEIANKTGVCIAYIGTPAIAPYFDSEAHLARRTRGPRIPPLAKGRAFETILRTMWGNIPVLHPEPLTSAKTDLIYRLTGGVLAKLQKLVAMSARHAIYFGSERVTDDLIRKVSKQYNIAPAQSALSADAPELILASEAATPFHTPGLSAPPACSIEPANMGTGTEDSTPKRGRGRPRAERDPNDLLVLYAQCRENGWLVTKALADAGLLEGGSHVFTL